MTTTHSPARVGGASEIAQREFLQRLAVATAGFSGGLTAFNQCLAADALRKIKLGLDNFAVRAMGWKVPQLIDYAVSLKVDSLFVSDLDAFESFEESYLKGLRSTASDKGLQLYVGTWSICPTSKSFRNKWGTAEEHLALAIRVAHAVGSPAIRVILGNGEDRKTEGGIEARIRDTVKVCRACRSQAVDSGVKIAVENHAGDMQARELAALVQEAGTDYVGVNLDSGNATWTLEDPLASLEVLGPYTICTSLRDSAIWETPNGATVQWTAMGDGNVDLKTYFQRYAELCPKVPVHIETISGFNREVPFLKPEFWSAWPKMSAKDLARFLVIARKGQPRDSWRAPAGQDRKTAEQQYQKDELERSLRYCRETLALGVKN